MNEDLYIELLEQKVSDLETALVTVSDKLNETEQVKKGVQSNYDKLHDEYCNMQGHYDEALELAHIIVEIINNEEDERWSKLKAYEKMTCGTEKGCLLYRSSWSSIYELKEKVNKYYESKVG